MERSIRLFPSTINWWRPAINESHACHVLYSTHSIVLPGFKQLQPQSLYHFIYCFISPLNQTCLKNLTISKNIITLQIMKQRQSQCTHPLRSPSPSELQFQRVTHMLNLVMPGSAQARLRNIQTLRAPSPKDSLSLSKPFPCWTSVLKLSLNAYLHFSDCQSQLPNHLCWLCGCQQVDSAVRSALRSGEQSVMLQAFQVLPSLSPRVVSVICVTAQTFSTDSEL